MREHDDSGNNSLHDLLSQVPDKHHAETRHEGALSINGRHPAPCTYGTPTIAAKLIWRSLLMAPGFTRGADQTGRAVATLCGYFEERGRREYYLVTPVEKCRVSVALHPLIITDIVPCEAPAGPGLTALLNAGGRYPISADYPLKLEQKASGAAFIELPHGLSALAQEPLGIDSWIWQTKPTAC
ncbi:MAG: hypothetical protein CM15mP84_07470 [Cellvibrionales bacterium]|nr:MAG: hypothetical protein CM15mP84_07470 [Cellvibrionales bacterium]